VGARRGAVNQQRGERTACGGVVSEVLTHRIESWKLKPLYDELKAQRDAKRNGA